MSSQMGYLKRFKVILSVPQYLTHLLLEGGDWGPGDMGHGAPIARRGPDRRFGDWGPDRRGPDRLELMSTV